jgi:hemoglobin/transferrin/lactoferrin receptor protein
MKKRLIVALALAGIMTTSNAGIAQTDHNKEYVLDPVTVTARGYAVSQSDTPGSVGVVEGKAITLAPKGSIVDALERIPGITRTGDSPWGQDISIRGLSGPSIVILVNGKRINTATDMNARLGFITPADVERIEVLKGPVSALYGSGSTGGVVNIITRKATFTTELEANGRLFGSGSTNPGGGSAYGNVSVASDNVWGFISGSYRDYGDTFGGHNAHVPDSDYLDTQSRGMFSVKPWTPLTLTVEAMQSYGNDIGIPGGVSSMPATARVRYHKSEFTFMSIDAALDIDGGYFKTLEANFYYTENKRQVSVDNIPAGTAPPYALELSPSADHETYGGKLQTIIEAGSHTIVAGADFWTWKVDSNRIREMRVPPALSPSGYLNLHDAPVPSAEQASAGVFAEDNWEINDTFTLNIGARLDYLRTESDPMYNVTPQNYHTGGEKLYGHKSGKDLGWHMHAGLTWKMTSAWSQSILLASSYRAADVMERFKYINLGGGVELYGNPDLDPEQSFYAEYALRYNAKPFKADVRIFANIVTDYIAEKRASASRIELNNVDDARIHGAELDLRWDFHDYFGVYGNIAALYARDGENDQALPGVAPVTGKVGVDFTHPSGFWGRLESDMVAPQHSTPDNVDGTKGVMLLGMAAGYTFHTNSLKHDISLCLNNIFDTRYYNYLAQQRGIRVWEPGFAAMLNYAVEF